MFDVCIFYIALDSIKSLKFEGKTITILHIFRKEFDIALPEFGSYATGIFFLGKDTHQKSK